MTDFYDDDDYIDPHILAHSDLLSYCITQNPNYFIGNHHRVMAEKLMAVERGEIKRLVITMPPRHGKPVEENQLIQMVNHKSKRLGDVNTGDYVITHAGRPQKVLDIFEQGLLDCVEITTASGRKTIAAYDHPFLTVKGYTDAIDLDNHCCLIPVKTKSYDTDRTGLVSVEETRKLINLSLENTKILRYLWSIDLIKYEYLGDKVVSVEKIGKRKCRCLAVEQDHTFLVNDLVVHNSQLASEYFVAWYLGRNPDKQVIFTTYSSEKAVDVGRNVRNQLLDPVFQSTFHRCSISPDAQAATNFTTTAKGTYVAVGIGGAITGRGANCVTGENTLTTSSGDITVEELYNIDLDKMPLILGFDHKTNQPVFKKVLAKRRSTSNEICYVKTQSNNRIGLTREHRVYSPGSLRGQSAYTPISSLRTGSALLSKSKITTKQNMYYMQNRKKLKKLVLQRLLFKNKIVESGFNMHGLRKNISSTVWRVSETCASWLFEVLLLGRMFLKRQSTEIRNSGKENKRMRFLQKAIHWPTCEVLLRTVSGRLQSFKNTATISCNKMRCLRERFSYKKQKTSNLFEEVQGYFAIKKNVWYAKLILSKRMFSTLHSERNDSNSNGQGQLSMLYLFIKRQLAHSSYRPRPYKKHICKPYNNVPGMSLATPQIENDSISSFKKISGRKKFVYDFQVEDVENFFCSNILVHNCLLVDDPVKGREQAESKTVRTKIIEWFGSVAYTRLMTNDNAVILIMTRWHFDDLIGYAIKELEHENWEIINLPAIADDDESYTFENGDVWERKEGEPLWPEYYDKERLEAVKKTLKSRDWNSLYQQRPQPDEGGMVNLKWFDGPDGDRRYDIKAIPKIERIYFSADTAFKDKAINDPSAIIVFGESKGLFYILEVINERMQYPDLKNTCIRLYNKYKETGAGIKAFLVEDKASGQSLIQDLRREPGVFMPIIPITPDINKILRLDECTGFLEGGYVRLPQRATWLSDFETQLERFPYDKHDDMVDSLSQFLKWKFKIKKYKNREKKKSRFWK